MSNTNTNNSNTDQNNNHPNNPNIMNVINVNVNNYFKLGSSTRRNSVLGCIGYEDANPTIDETEKVTQAEAEAEAERVCSICLENVDISKNNVTTACGHTFCLSCLLHHLNHGNACPLCRAPIEEGAKKPIQPLTLSDGIVLLNNSFNYLNVEQQIQTIVSRGGGDMQDDLLGLFTEFGFDLLYDTVTQMQGGEDHIDPEWLYEMYGSDSSSESSESSDLDSDADTDADSDVADVVSMRWLSTLFDVVVDADVVVDDVVVDDVDASTTITNTPFPLYRIITTTPFAPKENKKYSNLNLMTPSSTDIVRTLYEDDEEVAPVVSLADEN